MHEAKNNTQEPQWYKQLHTQTLTRWTWRPIQTKPSSKCAAQRGCETNNHVWNTTNRIRQSEHAKCGCTRLTTTCQKSYQLVNRTREAKPITKCHACTPTHCKQTRRALKSYVLTLVNFDTHRTEIWFYKNAPSNVCANTENMNPNNNIHGFFSLRIHQQSLTILLLGPSINSLCQTRIVECTLNLTMLCNSGCYSMKSHNHRKAQTLQCNPAPLSRQPTKR